MKSCTILLSLLLISFPHVSFAQYPERAVEIVVPYPPGGGPDTVARSLANRLAALWKQPVIVQNKPGANAAIGQEAVVRSAPDGYTLLMTSDAPITTSPHLVKTLRYDPLRDLKPVTQVVSANLVVLENAAASPKSMAELIGAAKEKTFMYASYGPASQPHIFFEALAKANGLKLMHVPYKGNSPSLQAVIAGEVELAMSSIGVADGHVKSGKLRALAISGQKRSDLAPDVPTLTELGYGDLDPEPWFGLFAPAGTPADIVNKIWRDIVKVYDDSDNRNRDLVARGYDPKLSSPDVFAKDLIKEADRRLKQIKTGGITLD
jgi:tripartite-type tricarboxylate transporter receptor subunit TctC